jgi:hypothetical protein
LVQSRLDGFGFRGALETDSWLKLMAVIESGLPRIFATLLLKFLDRDLLIGLGDNRVSAEHGGRLPASDLSEPWIAFTCHRKMTPELGERWGR